MSTRSTSKKASGEESHAQEGTHHNDYGSYEIVKCDPAAPDPIDRFRLPKSLLTQQPGNPQ